MHLTGALQTVCDSVLGVCYPQRCTLCTASVESYRYGIACEHCWKATRLFKNTDTICWKCGRPAVNDVMSSLQLNCRECAPLTFTAARACGVYEKALRATVLELKKTPHLPIVIQELLFEIAGCPPLDLSTRIIPVPLHPLRERARGFNQATVIATVLARSQRLPLDELSLVRLIHNERYRAGLDSMGRAETVAGAFRVQYPQLIHGESILLVDDVFTTGATASSCAEVLLEAGANAVFVVSLARPGA